MTSKHVALRLLAAVLAASCVVLGLVAVPASAAGGPNLAAGRTATASSSVNGNVASNITDGNPGSYWEGTNHAFPQWAQVDLGTSVGIDQVVLKLPPSWGARNQTLSVQGSADGTGFSTIVNSASHAFAPSATINFPATVTRFVRIAITANTGWPAGQLSELEVYGASTSSDNLAEGKTMSAGSTVNGYVAANANDGNQATYWESANHAFPQWIQVDLGAAVSVNRLVLKLPASWGARTQTITVRGSTNGSAFTDLVPSTGYSFNPVATISFNAATTRYLRLHITANTGWPAGQLSEFEVYGPATGDTQPPSAPANLAYAQPVSGQIRLTWNASTDNVGVTGYDVYANGALLTSVTGTSHVDQRPDSETVSYHVKARDAAGNQSPASNTVTRQGQGGDTQPPTAPANLAYTQPAPGQIRLTWNASTDNVGVTGYEVYANGALRTTVTGTTHTDNQPDSATVTYHVKAKDAAGNLSAQSNTVTRQGSGDGTNLAAGKEVTASGHVHTFVAAHAVDGDLNTYWEANSGAFPNTLTVKLGANAALNRVVLKLNPSSAWGTRTQNIQILGRDQGSSSFTSLVGAANHTFDPATGNSVSIPVPATAADVQLRFASNTGAPGGQVAEFQVFGTPAPNPDLVVTAASWTPASPVETDAITLSATVKNQGTAGSVATGVNLYLGDTKAGTAAVGALAAGASATVTAGIGPRDAGSYQVSAKVDEDNGVIEQNEGNNSFTAPGSLTVRPVDSSDLVPVLSWTPGNPASGATVTFSVALKNQGTVASASGAHPITVTVLNDTGGTVKTLNATHNGAIAAGATTAPVGLGTWTAAGGRFTVRAVVADDANELPVKRANNTVSRSLFVGRGANMPYDHLEAEDAVTGGGATTVGPNRTIGDLGGEASGRRAVTLNGTGAFVEFTTKAQTNTLVTRFSIPDSPGGGISSTLNVYVNGAFHKALNLSSKHMWLYGAEASPNNSPGSGAQRHIYDEANLMLDASFPPGTKIKLQKDAANTTTYAIDFVDTEQVAPIANPDPAKYVVPNGFTHQDVQAALDKARMESGWEGVYLPAGNYQTSQKFNVYGKAVKVVGAGPWFTRFYAPTNQENTDLGFDVPASANGTRFAGFAVFGNYTSRQDGPGKVFNLTGVSDITIDNLWIEHQMVMVWGTNLQNVTVTNSRVRDLFADAINFTNNSDNNVVRNVDARTTGDDAFALFNAVDIVQGDNTGNVFENLSATLPWRAAGIAVYGGFDNVFRNIYIADTLTYSGITISSLDFGYAFRGFGTTPTRFENISIVRCGGHFWGAQTFPGIWLFSASKEFRGIRVNDVDIVDPTYHGIMFQTKYTGGQPENPVTDTILTNVSISGARKSGDAFDAKSGFGIWANELPEPGQGPAVGSATFNNLTLTNNHQDIRNTTTTFTINRN
ncbi:discoidin domain-containing protein [Nonomuraea sp. NPDC050790]|uniref:discoidin domain-containing protein n=1 Tax=Nonomuraea sp. NPDC050790 TaxID=3364371 RepID=UPI003796CD9A